VLRPKLLAYLGLLIILAACNANGPDYARFRRSPSPRELEANGTSYRQECFEEFFAWGSLSSMAQGLDVESNVEDIAAAYVDVHDLQLVPTTDPSYQASVAGCEEGLLAVLDKASQAMSRGWGKWGIRERWIAYRSTYVACRNLARTWGLYRMAEEFEVTTVTPVAIARDAEAEGPISHAGATYDGCLKGIREGLVLREADQAEK
jgi:hypothetical protein